MKSSDHDLANKIAVELVKIKLAMKSIENLIDNHIYSLHEEKDTEK